jgi:hypothetical protein
MTDNPHNDLDPALVAKMAAEIGATGPLHIAISSLALIQLAGVVQMALRHPKLDPRTAGTCQWFLEHVRAHFDECPGVLDVLHRGQRRPEPPLIVL